MAHRGKWNEHYPLALSLSQTHTHTHTHTHRSSLNNKSNTAHYCTRCSLSYSHIRIYGMRKYLLNLNFNEKRWEKEKTGVWGERVCFWQAAVVLLCDVRPGRRVFTAHRVHFTSDWHRDELNRMNSGEQEDTKLPVFDSFNSFLVHSYFYRDYYYWKKVFFLL